MPEMIAAELQFESVGGAVALRRSHHTGIVDQDVDRAAVGVELLTQGGDAGQRRQIERLDGQLRIGNRCPNLVDGGLTLGAIADRHHDVGARCAQATGQSESQAAVGSGDDGQLSGQIGHGGDEIGGHAYHSLCCGPSASVLFTPPSANSTGILNGMALRMPPRVPGKAAALAVGALPALALPAPSWWWLAWFGLVPLLLVVRAAPTPREASLRAWCGISGFVLVNQYWLAASVGPMLAVLAIGLGALWLPYG